MADRVNAFYYSFWNNKQPILLLLLLKIIIIFSSAAYKIPRWIVAALPDSYGSINHK